MRFAVFYNDDYLTTVVSDDDKAIPMEQLTQALAQQDCKPFFEPRDVLHHEHDKNPG